MPHLSRFNYCAIILEATVADFATVQNEGARQVKRNIEYNNLDVIISRVQSKIPPRHAVSYLGARLPLRSLFKIRISIIRFEMFPRILPDTNYLQIYDVAQIPDMGSLLTAHLPQSIQFSRFLYPSVRPINLSCSFVSSCFAKLPVLSRKISVSKKERNLSPLRVSVACGLQKTESRS